MLLVAYYFCSPDPHPLAMTQGGLCSSVTPADISASATSQDSHSSVRFMSSYNQEDLFVVKDMDAAIC